MNSQFTFSLIFLFKQNKVYELTNAYHAERIHQNFSHNFQGGGVYADVKNSWHVFVIHDIIDFSHRYSSDA